MIYERNRLCEGVDGMGFHIMRNAFIKPLELRYQPPSDLSVVQLDGKVVWRKVVEKPLLYDSKLFAEEFREAMGYRKVVIVDERQLDRALEPPVLAIIKAVCGKIEQID